MVFRIKVCNASANPFAPPHRCIICKHTMLAACELCFFNDSSDLERCGRCMHGVGIGKCLRVTSEPICCRCRYSQQMGYETIIYCIRNSSAKRYNNRCDDYKERGT